ncbi:hypothetical protein pdam_00024187 [Pocillopora damicornis]|uniref:Uncharacterized protein n=1 Tax=Pocillopora damicornis TaxID=46731 RepID=A0A3M6UA41_POCDA|nr:hypothetical protein pdam_00024187 [Pocillopora damicornis]
MKLAFEGFKLDDSLSADANQEATKRVIEAVVADHNRSNRFPWSAAEMKGAGATYLKSLCDASTRAKKGKREAHRNLSRKQRRMREVVWYWGVSLTEAGEQQIGWVTEKDPCNFGCCWKGRRLAKIDSASTKNMGDKFTKITIFIICGAL